MKYIVAYGLGIIIGAIMTMWIAVHVPLTKVKAYDQAITECEKSLPRDQHCTIVALPISYD